MSQQATGSGKQTCQGLGMRPVPKSPGRTRIQKGLTHRFLCSPHYCPLVVAASLPQEVEMFLPRDRAGSETQA